MNMGIWNYAQLMDIYIKLNEQAFWIEITIETEKLYDIYLR